MECMDNFELINQNEILDYFSIDEMKRVVNDQILNKTDYAECGIIVDHLKPMYARYKNIRVDVDAGVTPEDVEESKEQFNMICAIFIDAICEKFGIRIDDFWFENASADELCTLTLYLYTFFVVDFKMVLKNILINYIEANSSAVAAIFDADQVNTKGATYNALKIEMTPEYALICANIFDAILYVLDTMDAEDIFKYAPEDYEPVGPLSEMMEDGHMFGEFDENIYDIVKNNSALKSSLAFEIISYFRETHHMAG